MNDDPAIVVRPNGFETIVYGGLAIGALDFLDATIFFSLYSGAAFPRIWQGVAAGLLGRDAAVAGGWSTATLGIFLHFVIAFIVSGVYFAATRVSYFPVRHAVISGLIYGVIVNEFDSTERGGYYYYSYYGYGENDAEA